MGRLPPRGHLRVVLLVSLPLLAGATLSPAERAAGALDVLQERFYSTLTGLWDCPLQPLLAAEAAPQEARQLREAVPGVEGSDTGSWWNCANSLEALCNTMIYSGNTSRLPVLKKAWDMTEAVYLYHKFFAGLDDVQWWALAWVRAADASGDSSYLGHAKGYFDEVTKYWDSTCGGGIWWDRKKTYKNAITNELFIVLAARLYQRTKEQSYKNWAVKAWSWFRNSSMINSDSLVNDGLSNCHNNGGETWTYNQGVILGGLADLFQIDGDTAYLDAAIGIADATLAHKTASGVLREQCEPTCNHDGAQFKGIFVRYLGYLAEALPATHQDKRAAYAAFIRQNAESLWARDRSPEGAFGQAWAGPPGTADGITQTSGLDCMNADLLLSHDPLTDGAASVFV